MIKQQELRKGNYILDMSDETGYVIKVEKVDEDGVYTRSEDDPNDWGGYDLEKTEGIRLTKEILLKAGFNHQSSIYFDLQLGTYLWQVKLYDDGGYRLTILRSDSTFVLGIYKYLHQLQNIIYSVSGDELRVW